MTPYVNIKGEVRVVNQEPLSLIGGSEGDTAILDGGG